VGVVVSDRADALALEKACRAGVPAVFVDPRRFRSRQAFDRELARIVDDAGARLVVLAGFMRILSGWFVRRYRNRILNIHPALLPAFPGARAVRDALAHGAKVTGVTVHFADAQVDHGPILCQAPVAVRAGDTEASLLARIHRLEHRLYPWAIGEVLKGKVRIVGRKVKLSTGGV
jgi:phosphoribosylglycinamide formyltransferase-1